MSRQSACHECGTLVLFPEHFTGARYHCPRCHALLHRRGQQLRHVTVLAATALIFFIPLLFLPILNLGVMGIQTEATLIEALWALYQNGYELIAFLILATGVIVPALMMVLLLWLLIPLRLHRRTGHHAALFRLYEHLREWGMVEVYLISIMVAIIKLQKMAALHLGAGLLFFALFALSFYITIIWFNPEDVWDDDALK